MRVDHSSEHLILRRYDCEDLGVELECWFAYEAESRGYREAGVQMEPDYPETWTLVHVYLPNSNVDISPVLYPGLINAIEDRAAGGD